MNEDLHNISEPAISANVGWQHMQSLLNEHLPVEMGIIYRKMLFRYAYTAMILIMLLLTTLHLDNNVLNTFHKDKISRSVNGLKIHSNSVMALNINNNNNRFVNVTRPTGKFVSFKKSIEFLSLLTEQSTPMNQNNSNKIPAHIGKVMVNNYENIFSDTYKMQTGTTVHAPLNTPRNAVLPDLQGKNNRQKKGSWNLLGGIGANTSFDNYQNLQPYPVAEARYNISPKFYIAAGLSAYSPVSTSTGGLSKTVYLNDTINNISLYNETTTYSHLHYADIPLSLGINITKNISLQSGIQLSVLVNKKTNKVLSPYDFLMNSITTPTSAPLTAFAPNMEKEYSMRVHNIDYRFIAGIRYTLKKTIIGLTYQHGLQPVATGTYANKKSSQVLALNLLFQIK